MKDVIETHLDECTAAMGAQNTAIEAAQIDFVNATETARKAFDEAVRAAQDAYGVKLQTSRDNAWKIIQARLSVWNGDAPQETLPPASTLESSAEKDESLAAFERDPTGGSA